MTRRNNIRKRRFGGDGIGGEHDLYEQAVSLAIDGRKSKRGAPVGLSMLDIMACGLGAIALLAVLQMLIRIPLPPPISKNFILVEVAARGFGQIAFRIIPPNAQQAFYVLPNDGNNRPAQKYELLGGASKYAEAITYSQVFTESGCDKPCPRSIAYLHIKGPAMEDWNIQPYFYQFRNMNRLSLGGEEYLQSALTDLRCSYWSRDFEFVGDKDPCQSATGGTTLDFPGTAAPNHVITVTGP